MLCKNCEKEFLVETEGREYVFCPYCGTKHFLVFDKLKKLRELLHSAEKNPEKNWLLAEELYNTVIVKRDLRGRRSDIAKTIGIKPSMLSTYLAAYEFAKEEKIDKSRMGVTKASRLAWCKDLFLAKSVLHDFYHKDIYTATLREIKEVVSDVNDSVENPGPLGIYF